MGARPSFRVAEILINPHSYPRLQVRHSSRAEHAAHKASSSTRLGRAVARWRAFTLHLSHLAFVSDHIAARQDARLRADAFAGWRGVVEARHHKVAVLIGAARLMEGAAVLRRALHAWHRLCR